ncbi:MAG: hypothetical protein ACK5AZ_21090 [Bryobacteraceae bacterium]
MKLVPDISPASGATQRRASGGEHAELGIVFAFSRIGAKAPGSTLQLGVVAMDFEYSRYFGSTPQTGYETVLYDILIGDLTLFKRFEDVEAAWVVLTPLLEAWASTQATDFPNYPAGSWGPEAGSVLIARDGRRWRLEWTEAGDLVVPRGKMNRLDKLRLRPAL